MAALRVDPARDYPLVLGDTFRAKGEVEYHSLHYKFKPQSAGRQRPGSIQLSQGTVCLQVPNAVDGMPDLGFEGQWAPAQEGLDCVALFDGSCWRLELLSGIGSNIRHTSSVPSAAHTRQTSEPTEISAQPPSREPSAAPQDGSARLSITPSVSVPCSSNPSLPGQLSTTPSMSQPVSRENSPSIEGHGPPQPVQKHQRQASPSAPRVSWEAPEAPQPSRGSPSIPPPNSMLLDSTSTTSTSSDDEEVVQQPSASPIQQAPLPASNHTEAGRRPDFEREFFQENSSSSGDESMGNASDSSDAASEEEAKHF